MNISVRRPGVLTGALVGVLVTMPLAALFYLGDQLAGLPFFSFDLFDWVARTMPGGIITFGIDAMIAVITGLGIGPTSAVAKAAEQTLALGIFLGGGVVISAALFAFLQARGGAVSSIRLGAALGVGIGALAALISSGVNETAMASPLVGAAWIIAAFTLWGAVVGWINDRLTVRAAEPAVSAEEMPAMAVSSVENAPAAVPSAAVGRRTSILAEPLDRRRFLITVGGAAAAITVVGAGLGGMLSAQRATAGEEAGDVPDALPDGLPNAGDPVEPVPGTRRELTPVDEHYQVSINLRSPVIDTATWTLAITGLVDNPLNLTLEDIRNNYTPINRYVTLSCISNPVAGDLIGTTLWTGASLSEILADAGLQESAAHLRILAADGFDETMELSVLERDDRIMLAYDWDGAPLTPDHGAPLRIYIPDRYGMKQPKWITEIQVVDTYEEGYWVRRGWDEVARMRATSVVDTIASDALIEEGDQTFVPVGGIAHAGARGISKVEVRVDEGEWAEAQLRSPLSDTTWVIWRYHWSFQPGSHTFYVRCYEGDGTPQIEDRAGARPSGATGFDFERAVV